VTLNLGPGDRFPDLALPDTAGETVRLSALTRPGAFDLHVGFTDGYPLIVHFYRGFFCPRDQRQFRGLVEFAGDVQVNYARMVSISTEPRLVQAAFRAGLGATWPFLSDETREAVRLLDILDETEGEYADPAQPYTLVLHPDRTIHSVYPGWWFVGRPTSDELRRDLRAVMERRANYSYEAYTDPSVTAVRIPQREWPDGPPPLGANGLPVAAGIVATFSLASGNGTITRDGAGGDGNGDDGEIFFNFTAIPGSGYRTIRPGTRVRFEVVPGPHGPTARNIQRIESTQ